MHRLWLVFAQAVTISVAVLFTINTLKPEWLRPNATGRPIILTEASSSRPESARATNSYATAAAQSMSAVVHIYTSKVVPSQQHPLLNDPIFRHFFGQPSDNNPQQSQSGLGSGVIVSPEGIVLTSYHVIAKADEIEVALNDGRRFTATLIGRDPETDLAALQLEGASQLPSITFAHSDALLIGDVVLAIGNPFGVGQTVTMGIVSALGRSRLGISTFENYIQTDAAINPGNSGGALVNTEGHLIGINTAIYSKTGGSLGIGFAIPISLARNVLEQIVTHGEVTRGWIGVETREITPELAAAFDMPDTSGALISAILRGSPADIGGILPGDVLLNIENHPVTSPQDLLETIAALMPGTQAQIQLRRKNKALSVNINIARRPAQPQTR